MTVDLFNRMIINTQLVRYLFSQYIKGPGLYSRGTADPHGIPHNNQGDKKETTNKFDCIPSKKATDAAMEDTSAEWLDGIPPVRQIIVSTISRTLLLRFNVITAAFKT
jgi:hypothetical protein